MRILLQLCGVLMLTFGGLALTVSLVAAAARLFGGVPLNLGFSSLMGTIGLFFAYLGWTALFPPPAAQPGTRQHQEDHPHAGSRHP